MSEYHTQQLRLAEYERLYSEALDQNHEQERIISRIESQNAATNQQIASLEQTYERQNQQFNQVTNQLQSNLKQQEESHQQQIAETRKEHVKNLRNVATNFNNQMGTFKNQVASQFGVERKNTKAMIDKAQQDSRKMINGVRQELSNKLKEQDQKINKIDIKVDSLKSDVDKLNNQDQSAASLAKIYYNDIKLLIEKEENSDISLFKKKSYWKDNNNPLTELRQRLNLIKTSIDTNLNQTAAGQAIELYVQYSSQRKHIDISHQNILEKYKGLLGEYKVLLNAAENSKKIKINGIDVSKLNYDEEKKTWTEEQHELEIDVDLWTNGKLGEFITKHKKQFDNLNKDERERNHEIDDKYIEKLQEKISGETNSYLVEYEAIIKEAKELALTSNLREVLGAKTINRLKEKYKGSFDLLEKGFERGDAKNNYHLRVKINGIERHLILGSNNNDPKSITSTLMEGNDYNTGSQDAFKSALDEQIAVMNECGLKLEVSDVKQGHGNACSGSADFIRKGMTQVNKEQLQIK